MKKLTRKTIVLGIGLFLVALFVFLLGSFKLMNLREFQLAGKLVSRVETDERVVALTFDDGPTVEGESVLETLAEKDVTATFYFIGQDIEKNKEVAKRTIEAGHEVGNHSYTHTRMVFKSPGFMKAEVDKTDERIRQAGYMAQTTFRPPYGKKLLFLPLYLQQKGKTTVTWDVEPETYLAADASAEDIAQYVVEHTREGSIILLHPWYGKNNSTREAIPLIIEALKEKGFRFVTVSELMSYSP